MTPLSPAKISSAQPLAHQPDEALMAAAQKLEASFLAEMLKAAGLGAPRDAFGGGAGEEHFTSFMVEAQAQALTAQGGVGLAEQIFNSLKETQDGT